MEEGALRVAEFLARSIFPVAVLAAFVGLVTIACAAFWSRVYYASSQESGNSYRPAPADLAERIVVGLCALISLLSVVVSVQLFRFRETSTPRYPAVGILFALALLAMGAPALLWKTRARVASEGLATIAVAAVSIVTGFSIGFILVPLVLVMMWVCSRHVVQMDRARRMGASVRVDSLL